MADCPGQRARPQDVSTLVRQFSQARQTTKAMSELGMKERLKFVRQRWMDRCSGGSGPVVPKDTEDLEA